MSACPIRQPLMEASGPLPLCSEIPLNLRFGVVVYKRSKQTSQLRQSRKMGRRPPATHRAIVSDIAQTLLATPLPSFHARDLLNPHLRNPWWNPRTLSAISPCF